MPRTLDSRKGYNDIFGVQVVAIPPIPRPHRKDLLEPYDIKMLHHQKKKHRIAQEFLTGLRVETPDANILYPSGNNPATITQTRHRRYQNPIAAAIDVPYVKDTRIPHVHPLPRLPPSYEAHLRDVRSFKEVLEDEGEGNRKSGDGVDSFLPLKFDSDVAEKFTSWPYHLGEPSNIFHKEDSELPTNCKLKEAVKEQERFGGGVGSVEIPSNMIHKTTWLKDVTRKGAKSNYEAQKKDLETDVDKNVGQIHDETGEGIPGWKAGIKMSGFERNVPYMLEVWQRVEGINLDELLHVEKKVPKVVTPHQSSTRQPSAQPEHILPRSSNVSTMQPPAQSVFVGNNITEESDQVPTNIITRSQSATNTKSPSRSPPKSPPKSVSSSRPLSGISSKLKTLPSISDLETASKAAEKPIIAPSKKLLSNSTLILLKKLTADAKAAAGIDLSPTSTEVDKSLRQLLIGTGESATNVVQSMTGVGGMKISTGPRLKKNTYRLKASGGFVMNAESTEGDFQLVIPLPDEIQLDPEEAIMYKTRVTKQKESDEARESRVKFGAAGAKKLAEQLEQATGEKIVLQVLPIPELSPAKKVAPENKIDLSRLVTLINRHKTQESSIVSYNPEEPIKIEDMSDFLMTPYTLLEQLPEPGTVAYSVLHQTALCCLLNQDSWELRFEAARILIYMQDFRNLGRWETIAFRNILNEAILNGTSDEGFLAGVCLCNMGLVDSKSVRRVKTGLGDFQSKKRQVALECLSNLDIKHANGIMDMLISESSNTSWRVRLDVIELLKVWIQKIDPYQFGSGGGEIDGSADAINAMSRQIKDELMDDVPEASSLHGSMTKLIEASNDRLSPPTKAPTETSNNLLSPTSNSTSKSSNQLAKPENRLTRSNIKLSPSTVRLASARLEAQVKRGVETLLNYMWNDWSREVRASATKTLAKLNQGKQAFDYIISLLEMADPSKKIDALRCLNGMGVITTSAMSVYLTTFKDTYFSVRIEACKVACGIVTAENRVLVNTLLDCLNDYDDKVRAYSVKAIGLSKCKEPRIREALYWCLIHDKCPSVRAESIHSIVELKLLQEDVTLRESIFVIMDTDNDEGVRREAERSLIKGGFLFDGEKARAAQTPPTTDKIAASAENTGPELGETISVAENSPTNDEMETSSDKHETGKTVAAVPGMTFLPQDGQSKQPAKRTPMAQASSTPKKLSKDGKTRVPQSVLPDAIKGMPDEDVELYFRECLVGEAEQQAVIDQVRDMSTASIVLQEVEQMDKDSSTLPELGLDLEFRKVEKFKPHTRYVPKLPTGIHYTTNRRISLL